MSSEDGDRVVKILKIKEIMKERDDARKTGNYVKSDRLRDTLSTEYGVVIVDQNNGPSGWKFKDGSTKKIAPSSAPAPKSKPQQEQHQEQPVASASKIIKKRKRDAEETQVETTLHVKKEAKKEVKKEVITSKFLSSLTYGTLSIIQMTFPLLNFVFHRKASKCNNQIFFLPSAQ
jgi:hypothetical protein